VFLPVLLQHRGGRENEFAFAKSALDLTRILRQMQIDVGFQEFDTFEILTAHLALVTFNILYLGYFGGLWSLEGEHFFIGEAQNSHFQFSLGVDADSQVLLRCCLGGKLFAAHIAVVSCVIWIWFPKGSESRNRRGFC